MEFLVVMVTKPPDGTTPAEVVDVRAREAAHTRVGTRWPMAAGAGLGVAAAILAAGFVPSRRKTAKHALPGPRLHTCAVPEPVAAATGGKQ